MPRETDETRLALLRRILADYVAVEFRPKALSGGERDDEGCAHLLQRPNETRFSVRECLRIALHRWLENGNTPNRVDVPGDDVRGDPATFYEFRLTVRDVKLFVKAKYDDDDADDSKLVILSVKRQW